MQAYHACVSFIDAQIGLVLEALDEQDLSEDTIVIFTSDHGYHLGDHFLWGKVTLFDIGTRVPLIIRVPGMKTSNHRSDAMTELVDLFPTVVELTGTDAPTGLQGVSLASLISDPKSDGPRRFAYSVVSRRDQLGRSIRDQKWRYTKWPNGEELYDLQMDPNEKFNLLGKAGEIRVPSPNASSESKPPTKDDIFRIREELRAELQERHRVALEGKVSN